MKSWPIYSMLSALAIVLLLSVFIGGGPVQEGASFRPDGYARVIRDVFVAQGLLRHGEAGERVVELSRDFSETASPALKRFYRRSSLPRDIALNNPDIWRLDVTVQGLAPTALATPSPFALNGWQGRLTMPRPSTGLAVLINGEERARLQDGSIPADGQPEPAFVNLRQPPDTSPAASPVIDLYDGAAGPRVARLFLFGRKPVIQAWGPGVRIDAHPEDLAEGGMARLYPGSTVFVGLTGRRESLKLSLSPDARAFARPQPLGGRWIDPHYAELIRPVTGALDAAVASCGASSDSCADFRTRSFSLSLDVDLDRRVTAALDRGRGDSVYPATVVVMDARNGEILAMASHDPAAPRGVELAPGQAPRLNYAFEPLAVGSAAKPPIAAAILSSRPALRTLEIRQTAILDHCLTDHDLESRNYVKAPLGVMLGGPDDCSAWISTTLGDGEWIGFNEFLRVSSNHYAAALSILGISQDPTRDGTIASDGSWRLAADRPRHRLPEFPSSELGPGPRFRSLYSFPDWGRVFDAMFSAGRSAGAEDLTDISIWRDISAADPRGLGADWALLEQVSPTRLAFPFDEVDAISTEYIPIILGGQNYGWSAVKLSEAYSRLITGRPIRARLISGQQATVGSHPEGYDEPLRARMCAGLSGVMSAGTGNAARGPYSLVSAWRQDPALGSGLRIEIFGKTGTPIVERQSQRVQRQVAAENRLIGHGYIQWRNGAMTLVGYGAPRTSAEANQIVRRASGDRGIATDLQGSSLSEIVGNLLKQNTLQTGQNSPYVMLHGRLQRAAAPQADTRKDAHVITFVVALYRGGDAGDCSMPPIGAYAVVVNLQDPEADALTVGRDVLAALEPRIREAANRGGAR